MIRVVLRALGFVLPLAVFLAAWQWYAGSDPSREFFYSTPAAVARTLVGDVRNGSLPVHAGVTAGEAVAGFVLGNITGIALGMGLWYFEAVARISKPYLTAAAAFPVYAIAPMTILWFGTGPGAKVALAFLGTVFLATAQAYKGAEQVDPLLLRRFRVLGAGRWTMFRHLLLPSSVAWIVSSLRITVGGALLGAFIGELIASDGRGLGHMIVRASGLYDTPRVLAGVLTIVAIALMLDQFVGMLERKLLFWKSA